jgi:hypothetical protein
MNGTYSKTITLDHNNPPEYMDCSAFSSSVYLTVFGTVNIGRTTKDQVKRGVVDNEATQLAKKGDFSKLKKGDLVLFDWAGDNIVDHVAIYVGNGYIVHSHGSATTKEESDAQPGKVITKDQLNVSWGSKYGNINTHIYSINRIIQDDNTIINQRDQDSIPLSDYTDAPGVSTPSTGLPSTFKNAQKVASDVVGLFEGGKYAVAGNYDGAGISVGWMQTNLKNNLHEILKLYANGSSTSNEFESIFSFDVGGKKGYTKLREVIDYSEAKSRISWGDDISDQSNKNNLIAPWKEAFNAMVHKESFQDIYNQYGDVYH